ncbi:MAG: DNA-processing protein DprA [Bacteroidales bacterium]|jgi:DNA processing protein|nr:DNA-processing protein DprA [Bacteroidales bacterium]
MKNDGLLYQISLTLVSGIGNVLAKKLINFCGSAEAVFLEKERYLLKIPGIGQAIVQAIKEYRCFDRAEEEIAFIERHRIQPLSYLDEAYPQRLKECYDAPILLYYTGNVNMNCDKILSVVGTRTPTEYGKEVCEKIVSELTGVLIVSGLAYGVDSCAHRAALKSNLQTIAVLAHGLDRIYPAQNKRLAKEIIVNGGLLTEFMSRVIPDRENFPQRNRIVAGMADATLVIETPSRGGSLITASLANSYNRDVFAIPGKITDPKSSGCNWLIRSNRAALVENASQIKEMMGWDSESKKIGVVQKKLFPVLTPDEEIIYKILEENGESSIDFIVRNANLTTSKISAALLNMEFENIIKALPGRMYILA